MIFRFAKLELVVLALLATGCSEDGDASGGTGGIGGSAEPIEVVEVPLPAGVTIPSQQNSTGFTVDGSRLFTTVMIEGVEGRHVATLARDGTVEVG
jgi:hypothetical protein